MITTELSNIEGTISSNAKLSTGMDFMRLMRSEGLLEASKGLFPVICGGAVRDGLFTGREINDIDIFLFRDHRSPLVSETIGDLHVAMADVRQNVLAWLEDMEIEHQSLLSDRASAYFGSQQFLDIIQFVWNNVTIQIMIPLGNCLQSGVDGVMRTMPLYSAVALTLNYLRVYDLALANYCMPRNHYLVGTERDVPYLRNKFPNGVLIPVNDSRVASVTALAHYVESIPFSEVNTLDHTQMAKNSTANLLKRAFLDLVPVQFPDRLIQTSGSPANTL